MIRFIDHFVKIFGITEDDRIGIRRPLILTCQSKISIHLCDRSSPCADSKRIIRNAAKTSRLPVQKEGYNAYMGVSALCLISALKGLKYKVPETVRKVMFSGESMRYHSFGSGGRLCRMQSSSTSTDLRDYMQLYLL